MNHTLKMVIGCVLPILLVFVLPLFGVSDGITVFVFVVLIFGCHLFMMGGHNGDDKHNHHSDDQMNK